MFFWAVIAAREKNGRWCLKRPFKRNYSCTLFTLPLEILRRVDGEHALLGIGILKAMGARDRDVARIFSAQGLVIGVIGSVSGTLLGFLVCYGQLKYKWVSLPSDIYFLSFERSALDAVQSEWPEARCVLNMRQPAAAKDGLPVIGPLF